MRLDKLTTKFQQALADAQSMAVGAENPYIEPPHVMLSLLQQQDGGTAALLQRAGANTGRLSELLKRAVDRLPKVEGTGGEIQVSRELTGLLNLADREAQKRGDQFIASEMFVLAAIDDKGELGRALREAGATRKDAIRAVVVRTGLPRRTVYDAVVAAKGP